MKAVTVYQPHASLIALNEKRIETRSWATNYRGPLAIHAAKIMPSWCDRLCLEEPFRTVLKKLGLLEEQSATKKNPGEVIWTFPVGVIVATCELINCIPITEHFVHELRKEEPKEYAFGDYTPGRFGWILSNIKPLDKPIPARGRQRLWNWDVPEVM